MWQKIEYYLIYMIMFFNQCYIYARAYSYIYHKHAQRNIMHVQNRDCSVCIVSCLVAHIVKIGVQKVIYANVHALFITVVSR